MKLNIKRYLAGFEGNRNLLFIILKDLYVGLYEIITRKKYITEKNSIFKDYYHAEQKQRAHSYYTKNEKISFLFVLLLVAHIVTLLVRYILAFSSLSESVISGNIVYILGFAFWPYISWIYATNENFWAFHKRKRTFFYLCSINLLLTSLQPIYEMIRGFGTGLLSNLKTNSLFTYKMAFFLIQLIVLLLFAMILIVIYSQLEPVITNQALKRQIEIFKLAHIMDARVNKEYSYDISIIKDLETGEPVIIKENDRYVQTEINGASGTGKTSSIFTTAIEKDMDTKLKNNQMRQEAYLKMIKEHKATLKGPICQYCEEAVIAIGSSRNILEKNEKELSKIKKKYPDAGITVLAPNASLNEDIIRLGAARDIMVNVLDPIHDYSHYENVKMVRLNPFYIPLGLSEQERLLRIIKASTVFAEVLIATNQMSGEGDPYFRDISLSVCTNVATVVMLAKNIRGHQAVMDDIQECINEFSKLREYVQVIERFYDIFVEVKKMDGNMASATDMHGRDEEKVKRSRKNPYYMAIHSVKTELLGPGATEMYSQARGLRILINKVVMDPRIKRCLSAGEEEMLDFDKILSHNQITVVNTAIELGASSSTIFGLFFILLHRVSILRRPMETRTPHFLWIDEAAQYMHPCYEDMISLYRQYRCAVVLAIQSLTQVEKVKATAYLKDVLLGAGTHIVFGRITPDEMELYSKMGGIDRQLQEQKTHSYNSLLTEDPSYTESVRTTPTLTNVLEGADMRILDFQELTVFTIDGGRVLPGKQGRVFFVREEAFDRKVKHSILWKNVVPEAFEPSKETNVEEVKATISVEETEEISVSCVLADEQVQKRLTENQKTPVKMEKGSSEHMSAAQLFMMLNGDLLTENNVSKGINRTSGGDTEDAAGEEEFEKYRKALEEMNNR